MENMKDPEFQTWLKAQADFTRITLDRIPARDEIATRLNELSAAVAVVSSPVRRQNRYFYLKRQPKEDVRKLYMRDGLDGSERLLFDPSTKATAKMHYSLDYYEPSPDGKYVIYGVSPGGSENSVLHVIESASGRDLGEAIDRTQYASPQWRPGGNSFFYWREQKRTAGAPPDTRYLNSKAYLHVLGRNADEDAPVLGRGLNPAVEVAESDFPIILVPAGSKYAIGVIVAGVKPEVRSYIAPLDSINGAGAPWRKLTDMDDEVTAFDVFGDNVYLLTHRDASRFKLIRTSASKPDVAHAEVLMPPGNAVLTSVAAAKDGVYVQGLAGGVGRLFRIPHGRTTPEQVTLPFEGAISSLWANARQPGAIVMMSSWTKPPVI
jgi:prolyl oligopeptidase